MGSLAVSEVCWLDGSVALIVRGVVDDATVEHFERRLDSAIATSRRLVVDLTACQLASAGPARFSRPIQRGDRAIGRRSRAATGAGNE
jgi:hypothetical protein